jgi:hypothetical protein
MKFLATMPKDVPDPGPTLHLSGPRLTRSFETLVQRSEPQGGVEGYIAGLTFKASVFQEVLSPARLAGLDESAFLGLCAFMAPVRRRIGPWFSEAGIGKVQDMIGALLDGAGDTATVDDRMAAFCAAFPQGRRYRWTRDMAADILHYALPEQYPLMNRWVWDHGANSGVLREIWHGDDVDHMTIDVPDGYPTFLVLREELSQFLAANGVFRDMLFYVDLLCAQVYADYICEQGGTFLRTDFSSEQDPMQYTRRMLGLDGIDPDTGRTRTKDADGQPVVLQTLPTQH